MNKGGVRQKSQKVALGEEKVVSMLPNPKHMVALQFNSPKDFRTALGILDEIEKNSEEVVFFGLPPRDNTLIIGKKYASRFAKLHPQQQEVGSVADTDITDEEVAELRKKHMFPIPITE